MKSEVMRERLIDLSKREIDLVELMNLTIYEVKWEVEVNSQNNFQFLFWIREPFKKRKVNHNIFYIVQMKVKRMKFYPY